MVNNGQPADQDTFNNAFVSKTASAGNDVTGIVSMSNGSSGGAISNVQAEINAKIDLTEKGSPNGVAELDGSGRVPPTQLPSYVDDVLEYADLASFPNPGETGKIYVALDTNKTYRWSGSVYIEISQSPVMSVFGRTGDVVATSGDYTTLEVTEDTNLYFTDTRAKTAVVDNSITDGVTDKAPSQNAVFDALAGKQATGSYITDLTGEVTASGPGSVAATISANAVTNAKLAQIATQTIKGRTTAGTGNVEDLTATQATAILNSFTGDSGSGGIKGLVPAPVSGDASKYLKGDGTWSAVTGSQAAIQFKDDGSNLGSAGTVASVDFVGPGVTAARLGNDVTVTINATGTGGGWTAYSDLTLTGTDTIAIDSTKGQQKWLVQASTSAGATLALAPFGATPPNDDGSMIRLVGASDDNWVDIQNSDAANGAILNGGPARLHKFNIIDLMWDSTLARYIEIGRNF